MHIEDIESLANAMPAIPDDRPEWMQNLVLANDEKNLGYYRFLHEFVKKYRPYSVIEIGTDRGASTIHLAFANPDSIVRTIDVEPNAGRLVNKLADDHGIGNILAMTADSAIAADALRDIERVDVLFIDALHDFNHCYGEYLLYRQLVKPGGVIFFDDIHVHREMEVAWDCIVDPKVELPSLHSTGFGACMVDKRMTPAKWADVIGDASVRFGMPSPKDK